MPSKKKQSVSAKLKEMEKSTRVLGYSIKTLEELQRTFRKEHIFVHKYSNEKKQALSLVADLIDDLLVPLQQELAERAAYDLSILDSKNIS